MRSVESLNMVENLDIFLHCNQIQKIHKLSVRKCSRNEKMSARKRCNCSEFPNWTVFALSNAKKFIWVVYLIVTMILIVSVNVHVRWRFVFKASLLRESLSGVFIIAFQIVLVMMDVLMVAMNAIIPFANVRFIHVTLFIVSHCYGGSTQWWYMAQWNQPNWGAVV